ncbi:SipW-dependent-type signal peptide-containing protein [Microbacterium sp. GXF7504]
MGATNKTTDPRTRRRRMLAVMAGGLALAVGGTMTLASWTDSEWVWGGAADGSDNPGIGTSTFKVLQNTDPDVAGLDWDDAWTEEPAKNGGRLVFSPLTGQGGSLAALTPGQKFYAPVALKTDDGSVAGSVLLKGAVSANGPHTETELWNYLGVRVSVQTLDSRDVPVACNAEAFGADIPVVVGADGPALLGTRGAETEIAENGKSIHYYCFEISLPNTEETQTLQGLTAAPAWEFFSTSN